MKFGLLRQWLSENVAVIISLSSMIIAGCSLYFTVNAQRADIEYKELTITPRLAIGPVGDDMSITVSNIGPGSAIIERVVFKNGDRCISSDDNDSDKWQEEFTSFAREAGMGFYWSVLSNAPWKKGTLINLEANLVQPTEMMIPGEKRPLVRLDPGTMKKLSAIDSDALSAIKVKFAELGYRMPIAIKYCSMTEKRCFVVGEPMCFAEMMRP